MQVADDIVHKYHRSPSSVGHTRVTIGYGGLRQVVATERKKVVQAVFLVTLWDHFTTDIPLIASKRTTSVRWTQLILHISSVDRNCKNVCHRPQATPRSQLRRICGICVITHVQYRTFLQSLASIAWTSCVYHPVVPNVFFFCFFLVCIHGSQRRRLYFCRIIAI